MREIVCPLCQSRGTSLICPVCKGMGIVHRKSESEKKKIRNERSRKTVVKSNRRLTKYELDIIKDSFYSTAQAAKILNRSIKSVESIRYRIRKGCYYGKKLRKK